MKVKISKKGPKKLGKKAEEEQIKKKTEQEEMKEEAHQLELQQQYTIDEEDEDLMD